MSARLVSLNVGLPRRLDYRGRQVMSGIRKSPVQGPLWLDETGLRGDAQADVENHGGFEKAVCVYPVEHYPYWEGRLGRALGAGSFGENFGTEALLEPGVCIGDIYRVGGAVVQVSQPRQPCFKLAARHGMPDLAASLQRAAKTGFYLRCLEAGEVRAEDGILLVDRPAPGASVAEANRVMYRDRHDTTGIERLLAVRELSAPWRSELEKRLSGLVEDTVPRSSGA